MVAQDVATLIKTVVSTNKFEKEMAAAFGGGKYDDVRAALHEWRRHDLRPALLSSSTHHWARVALGFPPGCNTQ